MQIVIDTPYVTPLEFARRAGLSERSVRHKIESGMILIKEKTEGKKGSVFINMVHLAREAAEQSDRVTGYKKNGSR
ncbi:hypothetical protein AB1462_16180 [Pseudomonas sp. SB113]|uniref:hypothetical protein n=1 Tax=Pseudomonas sp. SB113 TaxID=3154123 RepID=UPI00345D2F20